MKKNILLSLIILLSIQVMSQEKGSYISLWGGTGPTGFNYKIESVNFAEPKRDLLLGGQAGLGYSYYFTKHVGISICAGISHYRTKAVLEKGYKDENYKDKFFDLGNYIDNDYNGHITDYQLRVRTQDWTEYQSVKFLEIPLMINFQKKFGEKEYFGLYLSIGAKFQLPLISNYSIIDGTNESYDKIMISGYYPEDNLELGYNGKELPQHGFNHIHNPSEVLKTDDKLNLKWNIAAVGEAGILVSLSRRVDIALGAYIDYGLMNINRKKDNETTQQLFTFAGTDYVSGAENKVGNGITYKSLIDAYNGEQKYVNKVNTFSYGGKIGLRIKLGKLSEKQQPQVTFAPCDKDTVYIYKFEPQPLDLDSILKEIKDALKEVPKYEPENNKKKADLDDYFPDYIPQEDIDILFAPIYFDLDKAILKPESIIDLDKKVEILNKYTEIKLIIAGNTCDLGTDPHNYKLGERRAEAAKNYLISKGISADRLDSSTLSRFPT